MTDLDQLKPLSKSTIGLIPFVKLDELSSLLPALRRQLMRQMN